MPKRRFLLVPDEPPRLVVSWEGGGLDHRVELDGRRIAEAPGALPPAGLRFSLPDGTELLLAGKPQVSPPDFEVRRLGVPLPEVTPIAKVSTLLATAGVVLGVLFAAIATVSPYRPLALGTAAGFLVSFLAMAWLFRAGRGEALLPVFGFLVVGGLVALGVCTELLGFPLGKFAAAGALFLVSRSIVKLVTRGRDAVGYRRNWSADRRREAAAPAVPAPAAGTPRIVECGYLYLPSGRLVACDPFTAMSRGGNPFIQVPVGRYPVHVAVADVSEAGDGSHLREAWASLVLSLAPEVVRRQLVPCREGEEPISWDGFPVDAGTACFVDDASLATAMPAKDRWHDLFEGSGPESWFSRMDDPNEIWEGIANITLPLARSGENLILFHSGWGDGVYPILGGFDAGGKLVAVHIDFGVLDPPLDAD